MRSLKSFCLVLLVLFSFTKGISQTYKIDVSKSIIKWEGKKITGQHEGTINFKEGFLIFKNKKVTGGSFIADMKTLSNNDQTGSSKAKLEGHLKSEDFFSVDNFTTSTLVFKSIASKGPNTYLINADLTIKGITNNVQFDLVVNGNKATASLQIDRTKYDIKYGSGSYFDDLGDKTIYDDFELNVVLAY
ncbi:YceI family protein [Flavobacterium gilvum]|uniref:Lipid-binding protein n=1 Tax=Flavobacterium gilvum TaxID=1492737 RepID=A0AAC9N7F7_9FLAO|nr:YceI family protein [Flavobacterium gilvum]AOW10859.1 lipid-binding protein [Flavobacterium gilvum]KFC61098.1 lipid-binding protein [Flavobacterium gilvum]